MVSLLLVFDSYGFLNELRDRLSVVHVADVCSRVSEVFWARVEVFLLDDFVWVVNVQLEVCHDGQVVPKDMFEVADVAEVREEVAHCVDDGVGAASPLVSIFDGQAVVHHVLDISTVFWKFESLLLGVVI